MYKVQVHDAMSYPIEFKSELTVAQLDNLSKRFEALDDVRGLCALLGVTENTLLKIAEKQEYHTFQIPKPGGEKRLIQHPAPALKNVQQTLNRYLQAAYFGVKPACAYGFIIRPADELRPRNIYFNAMQHHKGEWFLNVDLKDFFHTVTKTQLFDLFRYTFMFPADLAKVLVQLCTCGGRLPMGAPTSPALSNFACIFMDYQLETLAQKHGATYTRYADDMTFSFQQTPPTDFLTDVRVPILKAGFTVNEKKVRLQNRLEHPEITGLVIGRGTKPTLSKAWLKQLKQEIKILRWLTSATVRERGIFHAWTFDRFRQSVKGQVEFVAFVLGKESREYRKMAGEV